MRDTCSPLVDDMLADGHTGRIANVDISPVIIDYMRTKRDAWPPGVTCASAGLH